MKRTGRIIIMTIICVSLLLIGCSKKTAESDESAAEEDTIKEQTIKLAHVVNEKDGFHIAAMKFEEIVEEW